jgi:hypothetical protein
MKLSKHVTRAEFEASNTAARAGIRNKMNAEQLTKAQALCTDVLDVIREYYKQPIIISSGYRSAQVNALVLGSASSQHQSGEAADFTIRGVSVKRVFDDIRGGKIKIEYDQLIEEFGGWVHISYRKGNNRKQALIARMTGGLKNRKAVYTPV